MSCKLQKYRPHKFLSRNQPLLFFVQLDHILINRKLSTGSSDGYIQNGSQTVQKMPNVLTQVDQFADQTLQKMIRRFT